MDETWEQWLSDLEVDVSNLTDHHRYTCSYDFISTPEDENPTLQKYSCCFQPCLSSESDSCRSSDPSFNTVNPLKMKDTVTSVSNSPIDDTSFECERPWKQLKGCVNITAPPLSPPIPADSAKNKSLASQKSASPLKSCILSFDKPSSTPLEATEHFQSSQACNLEGKSKWGTPPGARNLQHSRSISGFCVDEPNSDLTNKEKRGRSTPKTRYHSKDHIMAERKRRENLSLRFIALSATIPGLKKTDKASVLGDAIRYVKQLQERVKQLEEDAYKSRVESVVYVKKSVVSAGGEDDSLRDDSSEDGPNYVALPEVEARVAGKNILVRIHCFKQKGLLEKLLREIENLHLVILNSCALPFGNSILDITIVTQMDVQYNITVKELVKHLRVAMSKFTCV